MNAYQFVKISEFFPDRLLKWPCPVAAFTIADPEDCLNILYNLKNKSNQIKKLKNFIRFNNIKFKN